MTPRGIAYILGILLIFLAAAMLLPISFSLVYGDGMVIAFLESAGITALGGATLLLVGKKAERVRSRDGFLVVFLAWVLFGMCSTLPFTLTDSIPRFADAVFESLSGLTTTGATILTDIEALPASVLFWRGLTHWLGGMGIIVLSLAILPFLGAGGAQLFKTEVPGPTAEKLTPRITETTKILASVYVVFTAILVVLMLLGGMNYLDAFCHSFSTMATGGFSTKNASLGGFQSAYLEWVTIVFMIIAGSSFTLHYRFVKGNWSTYFNSREFIAFIGIITFITIFISVDVIYHGEGVTKGFRDALFQTVSIITTTGYGTADYDQWSASSHALILFLMFTGGCAGSTSGGIKVIRILILFKYIAREITRLLHSQAVVPVRVGKTIIPRELLSNLLGFFILFVCTFGVGTFLMTIAGLNLNDAISASISALGNIGPGFGKIGPTQNYEHLSDFGKYVLSFLMLMGRLEIFAVIIFLSPEYWKK